MTEYKFITYEVSGADQNIARITLDRPGVRNAQHRGLLVELDDAFVRAESDDSIRVVILRGAGKMFSSGHDLGSAESMAERERGGADEHPTFKINGGTREGAEQRMMQEWHYFFQNTLRWRNLRKITIAQAHGGVYAAGLMLMWACDLIVAAEGTVFADVVGTRLGMCGVEYFGHPWEFGPRRAKELLLTGDYIDADEGYRLGMISKVFSEADIDQRTLELADRVALLPTVTSLLIKESVNQAVDNMGFYNSLQAAFTLHQLNHSHWAEVNEDKRAAAKPETLPQDWRKAPNLLQSGRS